VVQEAQAPASPRLQKLGIVDCDVHVFPTSIDEIKKYMTEPFKSRHKGGGRGFYGNPAHGNRLDAVSPSGAAPGTDPTFVREQHMDFYGVDYAVLLPRAFCNLHPDPDRRHHASAQTGLVRATRALGDGRRTVGDLG
jgi:hypothetical protein